MCPVGTLPTVNKRKCGQDFQKLLLLSSSKIPNFIQCTCVTVANHLSRSCHFFRNTSQSRRTLASLVDGAVAVCLNLARTFGKSSKRKSVHIRAYKNRPGPIGLAYGLPTVDAGATRHRPSWPGRRRLSSFSRGSGERGGRGSRVGGSSETPAGGVLTAVSSGDHPDAA